jgi:hypothetical protein
MEKINSIVAIFLLGICSATAQVPTENKLGNKLTIVHRELHIEAGVEQSMIYNDTLNQRFGSSPFLTFHYHNFLSDKILWTMSLSPLASHVTKNEKRTLRERYVQMEAGISGSYMVFNSFWVTAGAGYSHRLWKSYRLGANAWEETNFTQPGIYLYGSVDYWIRTTSGIRVSTTVSQDGYVLKFGVFMNFNTIYKSLKF